MNSVVRLFRTSATPIGIAAAVAIVLPSCKSEDSAAGSAVPDRPAASPDASPVLARVGEHAITQEDFEEEVRLRLSQRRPMPEKAALLQEMIERQALLQRARAMGLDAERSVRRELDNLLLAKLRERELESRLRSVEVSEAEVQAAYEARLAEFTRPAMTRVALLHLKAGSNATAEKRSEVRTRLEEARKRILAAPAPGGRGPAAQGFGALAIDFSEDQTSRYRGGDIGWLDDGSLDAPWPREVLETAFSAEKGAVSEILEVDGDFYLVMKTDHREAAVQPLADVRKVLEVALLRTKREEVQEAFRTETMQAVETAIDEAALAAVPMPAAAPPAGDSPRDLSPPALPAAARN